MEKVVGGGGIGWWISFMSACVGVRPAFLRLQEKQELTTFPQSWVPPWLRGITWSRVKSLI